MSYSSKVIYEGDSVTTDFNVPMPYLSTTHISVYVNDILQLATMHYSWTNSSTISFNTAPETGAAIKIQRWTSPASTLVDFTDGSTLRADDLDTAYLHTYYLSQEYADSFNELINNALLAIAGGTGIVETETDAVIAALVNEMLADANAANLQQRINDIDTNAEAIITLGEGLQTQINTLAEGVAAQVFVQADEPVPGVGGIPDPIPEGARWYDTDDNNAPYIYQSSAWVPITDPRIGVAAADIDLLQVQTENTNAALLDEMFVRATETTALSSRLDLLGAASGDNTAFILDLDKVYASDSESLSSRFSTITADWTAADAATLSSANGYTDGEAATLSASITNEAVARANADGALASTIALMGAENGTSTAFILDTSTVKIDSDAGETFATRLAGLAAADSANSASITTIQTVTIPGVESDVTDLDGRATDLETFQTTASAEYGVTLDVNGAVSGFKLISTGAGSSKFLIAADKFAIVNPGNPDLQPFTVDTINDKIVMNGDVEVNGSLLVNGSVPGGAIVPGGIGQTQIGTNAIQTGHLSAGAVTASKIEADQITATHIGVSTIAALGITTGSLTVDGALTMNTSGYIRNNTTTYSSGTGFFLGYDSSGTAGYKFRIGNTTDNFLTWDGSTLQVIGDILVGVYAASSNTILSATTERTSVGTNYSRKKTFTVDRAGTIRVSYQLKRNTNSGTSNGWTPTSVRIYRNSTLVDTQSNDTTTYLTKTDDVTVSAGDQIHLDLRGGTWYNAGDVALEPATGYIRNAYIQADVALTTGGSVDLN